MGYHAGLQCTAKHWLEALDTAVNRQFPAGVRGQGLALMSDNGCQPTSLVFMQACASWEVHQAFTSYNNPKGNADTERFMRTLKEECLWLREWTCPLALLSALTRLLPFCQVGECEKHLLCRVAGPAIYAAGARA